MDHISIRVPNEKVADVAKEYATMLAPLGIKETMRFGGEGTPIPLIIGMSKDAEPFFWIVGGDRATDCVHLAFKADTKEQVHAFHEAATGAGLKCNGKPGPRPEYFHRPGYYAAFVIDSLGNNLEAVIYLGADSNAQAA